MLFVGDRVLIGSGAIADELPGLIESHLAAGGLAAPEALAAKPELTLRIGGAPVPAPTPELAPIHAVYFYQPGCDACERAERDLEWIQHQNPQLIVERYDVREYAALNEYLSERVGLEERLRLVAPSFFVGDAYLVGADVRAQPLRDALAPYLETGAERFWEGYEESSPEAERSIIERFRSLNVLAVVGAGLLDGVNPCAFATMIFLVSYLTIRKRARHELLLTGIAFTAGVFVAYLGIGLGMFRLLDRWPALEAVGRWIYLVTAVICLALAWGSFADFRKARQGRLDEMTLKMPDRLAKVNRKLIREGASARGFVLASFGLGLVVSVIELACTGQVYLPTIVFVLGVPGLRTRATLALLLYNLMFILPLVVVFLLVYLGTTSQQLLAWMKRHAASVKLATGVLFLVLSGWLVYSVVITAF
jgi:cytochrome c biogenesis protein CcdA